MEIPMTPYVRPACLALVVVAAAMPARAQNWVYEPDTPGQGYVQQGYVQRGYVQQGYGYQPRVYNPGYVPAADLAPPAYDDHAYVAPGYAPPAYLPEARVAVGPAPLALTSAQRTTIYRTIIPQGNGLGPIVRERIVTETIPAEPLVSAPLVAPPVVSAPVVGPVVRAPVVRPRVGVYATDYAVGSRIADSYALAPLPPAAIATAPAVRSYRYVVINDRVLLVNPVTGVIVADLTQ
jgi:hypothetical protein